MFKTPNDKQYVDDKCNLIFPWYTKPCLDFIKSLDLSQSSVYEWGGGCSTIWYAANCKEVTTLESDELWSNEIRAYISSHNISNISLQTISVPPSANTPHPNMDQYLSYIKQSDTLYDMIIIDGSYRNEALLISESYVKDGGYLIFDNYMQKTSGYPTLPNAKLIQHHLTVYAQPGFEEWKTAVWAINRSQRVPSSSQR